MNEPAATAWFCVKAKPRKRRCRRNLRAAGEVMWSSRAYADATRA
ncbi:hypothetical protein EMGBD4_15720 [Verrucomicrobiota bacterium]|nr:hypothetical protein EMGBD4_15720 [Verrucomicrobiota bacterium]